MLVGAGRCVHGVGKRRDAGEVYIPPVGDAPGLGPVTHFPEMQLFPVREATNGSAGTNILYWPRLANPCIVVLVMY